MIVGLTGGIGSGKTWICSLFAEMGIPVYISDMEAKNIMITNETVKNAVIELFGKESYFNGELNRKLISEKVFSNKRLLEKLNSIVHPAVANHFKDWYKEQKSPFVIKESAILFEIGAEKKCDAVILVTASVSERIQRVKLRDNSSAEMIQKRINNQWPDNKKIPLANYIITNTKRENTLIRVQDVYNHILSQEV